MGSKLEEQVSTSDLLKKQQLKQETTSTKENSRRHSEETRKPQAFKYQPLNNGTKKKPILLKTKLSNTKPFLLLSSPLINYQHNGSISPRRTSQPFRQNVTNPRKQAPNSHRGRSKESHGSLLCWHHPHGVPPAQLLRLPVDAHVFPRRHAISGRR